MRVKSLAAGLIGLFVIILIFGGFAVIAAYLDGERSVIGALAWSIEWSYGVSPILAGLMMVAIGILIALAYTGLRSSKHKG